MIQASVSMNIEVRKSAQLVTEDAVIYRNDSILEITGVKCTVSSETRHDAVEIVFRI